MPTSAADGPAPRTRLSRAWLAAAAAALFATALSAYLSRTVFDGIPHVSDGVSYAFQGKILASGRFYLPPPPVPEAFDTQNVILTADRWCSKYPPGFPLLLAPGWWAGAPWLVNPILFGLAVLGAFQLARLLHDDRTALLAAALLAISPFGLLMGAGFMSHVPALAAGTWCLAALVSGVRSGRGALFAAAGFLGAFTFAIRPLTAVLLLAPGVAWSLWTERREGRGVRSFLFLSAGALPVVVALLALNQALFGSPFRFGYTVYNPGEGFRDEKAQPLPPLELLPKRLSWYLYDLSAATWGWPFGDLVPILALLLPRARRRGDLLLAATAAALVLGHAGYAFYDINHSGPRYAFEALAPLAILVARGLLTLAGFGETLLSRAGAGKAAPAAAAAALLLLAIPPLGLRLPYFAQSLSRAYHGQSAEPLRRAAEAGVGPEALVLVSGRVPAFGNDPARFSYGSFFLENALDPRTGRRVFAQDGPALRPRLLEAYPRPEVWTVYVEFDRLPEIDPFLDNTWELTRIEWTRLR